MSISPPDPQGVREGVQSRAAAERRGGQQVSRLRLRRHLGHRQNPDPSDGAAPCQAAAKQVPQLHRGRPRSGENGAGRHERDQLLRCDGKSPKDARTHTHTRRGNWPSVEISSVQCRQAGRAVSALLKEEDSHLLVHQCFREDLLVSVAEGGTTPAVR